ncbi:MAG: aldo/keto reductase [Planctomycetes bacterium]|nr:aldo/keto reductase [Planctomycetota bacterium]
MPRRKLGQTGIDVSVLGFGAFKIGRSIGSKYPIPFEIPTEDESIRIVNEAIDLGYTLIDTAPAYGFSEERIGRAITRRRTQVVLSTKVGECFDNGDSTFDFTEAGVRQSLERSFNRLRTDVIDIVLIHSHGDDLRILERTDVVAVLSEYKHLNRVKAIGLSGKSIEGAINAMRWADVLMVEYHLNNRSHQSILEEAGRRNVGVLVKKGLDSGRLSAATAVPFVLSNPNISSLLVGVLNIDHLRQNLEIAMAMEDMSIPDSEKTV